ncbi:MAG TPA: LCP family protein [Capillimicrobium sp.]|nr:LCP family protein [Capillimicrobium sp.]
MSEPPDQPVEPPSEPPQYTKYRSRPRLLSRGAADPIADLRARERAPAGGAPGPTRRRFALPWRRPGARPGRRITWQRVLGWVALAIAGWVLLSFVLFLISAQLRSGEVSDETKAALDDAGYPLTSPNNILVLGSDQRVEGTKEPGAATEGPSRSDSIMLLRVGGGHSSRLSIARDTLVDIPGHGTDKINAAYAYGGAALSIQTIRQYLGIEINHVIEVDFENFPKLIDALGGITYRGGCVLSRINGGDRNGGYTLRLKKGSSHLDGEQALALARTRKNECAPEETDLDRAKRQQQVLSAMKDKLATPGGLLGIPYGSFYRLPLVGWRAPAAFRSDMGGLQLTGVFGALAVGGTPKTEVLGTLSGVVPEEQRDAAVARFLKG